MAKFSVTFNEALCKACGLCINACPKKIIALNTDFTNDAGYTPSMMTDIE